MLLHVHLKQCWIVTTQNFALFLLVFLFFVKLDTSANALWLGLGLLFIIGWLKIALSFNKNK